MKLLQLFFIQIPIILLDTTTNKKVMKYGMNPHEIDKYITGYPFLKRVSLKQCKLVLF